MSRIAELEGRARRLLVATAVGAIALATWAVVVAGGRVDVVHALALAAGIAVGEMLRVDLTQRSGGTAAFGLGDAALTAGLLLVGPAEVVLGAVVGVAAVLVVERVPPVKFATNVVQYLAGAAAAALAVHALAPRPGAVGPAAVAAVAIGVTLFLVVNAVTVGGMMAFTSGRRVAETLRALLPTGALLALGDTALGLLAVLLLGSHPWALPALGVPVVLLWSASRQGVRAHVDRERSAAFVEVEHALGAAETPDQVADVLAQATGTVLGCEGAVWRDGRWVTPVPQGSGPCPVDGSLSRALRAPGTTLGLGVPRECVVVGLGAGVLVAWGGELPLDADAADWMEQLARSGRVHLSRAAGAVALEKQRATLGAVVDGTGDGVLLVDPDGAIAVWNPAMARLSGIPIARAVGHDVHDLLGTGPWQEDGVHDVDRPTTGSVWRVSVAGIEDVAVASSGRLWVVAVHDVTAERRAAQTRDDMLAVVSHELRTPLTPIMASAQLLRRRHDRLDEAQRVELLAQIEDRAGHLARLVDDLLLAGQLSARARVQPRIDAEPIDVGAVVADAVAAMRLARPRHRLEADVVGSCTARTDQVRLRQIVDNLLDNACKFSPDDSLVQVRLRSEEDLAGYVVLEVVDHGRGIPPAHLERVFDQFVRVEDPLHMTTSGAGLGLFIVRELTGALGGTLAMDSHVGVGTSVSVRLPRLMSNRSGAAFAAVAEARRGDGALAARVPGASAS